MRSESVIHVAGISTKADRGSPNWKSEESFMRPAARSAALASTRKLGRSSPQPVKVRGHADEKHGEVGAGWGLNYQSDKLVHGQITERFIALAQRL
jgi:hypothetical protein